MADESSPEAFLPPPASRVPLRHIRSTVLVASLGHLRERGRLDDYLRALPEPLHRTLLEAIPGMWLPADAAIAHYAACDTLGYDDDAAVQVGRRVSERLRGTLLGTVVRLSKGAGATPWTVLPHFQRFWSRLFDGSALAGFRLGPKEARLDVLDMPLCTSRYFRGAVCGQCMAVVDLFCRRSYCAVRPAPRGAIATHSFRVQWV
jgi:hypothetical protein